MPSANSRLSPSVPAVENGRTATTGGPVEYIPLKKGFIRGDPGVSLRTGRPVADTIFTRLRNSLVLAGIAFLIVMPLALVLGIIAGINEGRVIDRAISIAGLTLTATPEFVTGIFLILIFVVLGTTSEGYPAGFGGLAVGLTLAGIHLATIPVDNTSVNPARSTGPALVVGGWALSQLWLFWVAPLLAVAGAVAAKVFDWSVAATGCTARPLSCA